MPGGAGPGDRHPHGRSAGPPPGHPVSRAEGQSAGSGAVPGVPAGELFRIALLRGGRGLRLGLTTVGFMLHQLCEALVPILIGVVIDQALEPGDPGALLRWLAVLAGVFLVLSLSYQRAAAAMVGVYGHAEQELRRLAVTRLLDPFGLRRAPGPGEALSLVTSDSYRVAGVSWSVVEQAATLTAILTASTALLLISVPLAVGVMVSTVLVLLLMRRLAAPLEARGLAEQGSAARAGEVATDMITGLRVLAGMHAQPEAAARYRAASDASRRGAVAAARAVLSYSPQSGAVRGLPRGAGHRLRLARPGRAAHHRTVGDGLGARPVPPGGPGPCRDVRLRLGPQAGLRAADRRTFVRTGPDRPAGVRCGAESK
ncbi:conserved hypothetical protein [Streptomyces clavuligerus]|nr:conserved hypothetical protein [Streptomyces clavuligerus]